MIGYMERVRKFMEKHQAYVGFTQHGPALPWDVSVLRMRLMASEQGELFDAMHERDMVKIVDGICDLLYVTFGTAVSYGLGSRALASFHEGDHLVYNTMILDQLFAEVHRSNMTKAIIGSGTAKYGKIGKGPDFEEPKIAQILDSYGIPLKA